MFFKKYINFLTYNVNFGKDNFGGINMSNKLSFNNNGISDTNIQLHEEKLDIAKKWIQTGEVNIHEEVLTEEKNITVPVNRKELVIEKKDADGTVEAIRIPISEERIEIVKHPTILEDVKIFKRQYQDIKPFEETLKKEKLHVETTGDAAVIYNESEKHL